MLFEWLNQRNGQKVMSVSFIEDNGGGQLGLWEITESTEKLLALLMPEPDEVELFLKFRNELRQKEWLATRLLIRHMRGQASLINYDPSGKPILTNSPGFLSITHAAGFVAIYYHPDCHPGIDIELITRNVERVAQRFLSARERADCTIENNLSNKDLMLRWCAKEAIFKMVPFSDIDFASQIACYAVPLHNNEGGMNAIFTSSNSSIQIPLQYRMIGDLLLVWGHQDYFT
jgi:4'-phosphopantetheinyl transferase EntD